jgi:hypothetical protein
MNFSKELNIYELYMYMNLLIYTRVNCFLVMAMKQKCLFVFFCCLLFATFLVPPVEGQTPLECVARCRRAFERQLRLCWFPLPIVRPQICVSQAIRRLFQCIRNCLRVITPDTDTAAASNPGSGEDSD